jgi:hypothetical protein
MRLDRARANHPPAGARCASLRKRNAAWQIFYFSLITRAANFLFFSDRSRGKIYEKFCF